MKNIYILLLILLADSSISNAQQWEQTPGPVEAAEVFTIFGDTLLAQMYNTTYISTNYGMSWQQFDRPGKFVRAGNTMFGLIDSRVQRSFNNGLTWEDCSPFHDITGLLAIDNVIIATDKAFGDNTRIFRSADNGNTWTTVFTSPYNYTSSLFQNKGRLFCGNFHELMISDDKGATWQHANLPSPPVADIRDFTAYGDNIFAASYYGILRSADNGSNWTLTSMRNNAETVCEMNGVIFAGGTTLSVSSDLGNTWTMLETPFLRVERIRKSGNTLFASTRAGMLRSDDNGVSWFGINNGLPIHTRIRNLFVRSTTDKDPKVFAFSTNIMRQQHDYTSWVPAMNGLPSIFVDLAAVESRLFASTTHNLYYSDNWGDKWVQMPAQFDTAYIYDFEAAGDNLLLSFASNTILVSSDGGATFTKAAGIPNDTTRYGSEPRLLSAAAKYTFAYFVQVHPYGWETPAGFFRSTDYGLTWTNSGNGFPSDFHPRSIAQVGDTIFAAGKGIYKSADGINWTVVDTSQHYPFTDLISVNNVLFGIANDLLYSIDNGRTWTTLQVPWIIGSAYDRAMKLAYDGKHLVAATSVRGVMKRGLEDFGVTSISETELTYSKDLFIHPNPASGTFNITLDNLIAPAELSIYDATGRCIHKESLNAGTNRKEVSLNMHPQGLYLLSLTSNGNTRWGKIIIR